MRDYALCSHPGCLTAECLTCQKCGKVLCAAHAMIDENWVIHCANTEECLDVRDKACACPTCTNAPKFSCDICHRPLCSFHVHRWRAIFVNAMRGMATMCKDEASCAIAERENYRRNRKGKGNA